MRVAPLVHFAIQIREGGLAVETNNSKLPRFNLVSKLRFHYKLDSNLLLTFVFHLLVLLTVVT